MCSGAVFLLVTLVAAEAPPAFARTVAPAVSLAAIGKQSAASILDFFGIWGDPYLTGASSHPCRVPAR